MLNVVVMVLIVAVVLTGGAVAVFYIERTSEAASLAERNVARLDEIATVMRANLWIDPQGNARAPLGDTDANGIERLPSWIVGGDTTPWGARYAYCPLAPVTGSGSGTASVLEADGQTSYQVTTVSVNRPGIAGKSYVVGTTNGPNLQSPDAANIVGFILSPGPGRTAAPTCSQVAYSGGFYTINAQAGQPGSVTIVSAKGTILSSPGQGLTSAQFDSVVYVAPEAAGNASGSDAADPMDYAAAYAYWLSAQPRVTTFNLAAGNYALTQALAEFRSDIPVRGVRFIANGVVTFAASGNVDLRIGQQFVARGVAFGTGISVEVEPGAELALIQSSVSNLSIVGGEVDVDRSATISAAVVSGGRLRFADLSTWLQPASTGQGVTVGASSPSQSASIATGPIVANGGEIVVDGLALNPPGSPQGLPTLSAPARIVLANGGTIGGANNLDEAMSGTCQGPDSYGRYSCDLICDALHPVVKAPSCAGQGALLTGYGRTSNQSTGIEGFSCGYRPDQPLKQEQVVEPVDGATQPGQIGTAVDFSQAPGATLSVTATCSMNP